MSPQSGPFLVAMNAQFFTRNDNKDDDTILRIELHKADKTTVAKKEKISGEFADFSTHSFDVPVIGSFLKNEVTGSYTSLHIDPNGNDTWKFNYHLTLRFSDQSTVTRDFNDKALSQDVRDANYPL
jgi:hypothetical protein